jgi:hypothetical protein
VLVLATSPAHQFFTIFGAALIAFGLVFMLVGWIIRRTSHSMRGPTERTQGTIVGFNDTPPRDIRIPGTRTRVTGLYWGLAGGGRLYRPTVEFTTADGTQVTATTPVGTNPRQGHVGDTVTVVYDPRNPERIRVATRRGVTGCLEVAFMLIGGLVAALGILIVIASR